MGEWREVALSDVARFSSGGTPAKDQQSYWGGSMPWVSAKDMRNWRIADTQDHLTPEGVAHGTHLAPAGSVLVLTRGMTLLNDVPICVAGRDLTFNQDVKAIQAQQGLSPRYLPYVLLGAKSRLLEFVDLAGHGTGRLETDRLKSLPLLLPPIADQVRIADILGALDDKIEVNRRMSECLEATGRAMYDSWRGEQPDRALQPIGEICRVLSGGTPSKALPQLWSGSIPWISPKVMTGIHCDEPDAFVTQTAIGNGTRLAPAGATLVMVRGMGLHKGVRVSQARVDVTFNQDVKALVPAGVEPAFLLFAVLDAQESLHEKVESSGHGTGVLATEVLTSYRIPVSDRTTRRPIAEQLAIVNDRIAVARDQTRTLAAIRDTLLPRLLDGRLTC